MTVVLAKRSDKPHARPRGHLHPTDNGDGADAGRSSMAPRQLPVPLRAARQGTQHSGTKLLSQPRHLIESRFMLRCRPLSISDTAPDPEPNMQGQTSSGTRLCKFLTVGWRWH